MRVIRFWLEHRAEVLALLAEQGASVDLASIGELDACLLAGVPPAGMSWGNPLKKAADVRAALAAHGLRVPHLRG